MFKLFTKRLVNKEMEWNGTIRFGSFLLARKKRAKTDAHISVNKGDKIKVIYTENDVMKITVNGTVFGNYEFLITLNYIKRLCYRVNE